MNVEMIILAAILLGAILLFSLEIFSVDKVSLLVLAALMATRLIDPSEAVTGFGNTATITVAFLLALSFGIEQTGALNFAAFWMIEWAGKTELRILLAIMVSVGVLSAFINNTAAVAIFLPLTLSVARQRRLDASRFLLPMSFAAIGAGTCTLIGTSTNLLVSSLVTARTGLRIGIFEIAPLGLILFGSGILYMLFVGRHLLASRRNPTSLIRDYRLRDFVTELILEDTSPLLGSTVSESRIRDRYQIDVIEIIRGQERLLPSEQAAKLKKGDILLVKGDLQDFIQIREETGVQLKALTIDDKFLQSENVVLVEAFVSPNSPLVDSTLKEVNFRKRYRANALAIRSHGRTIREKIGKFRLEFGDSLLVLTKRDQLPELRATRDFLVLEELGAQLIRRDKIYLALGIFGGVILTASVGLFSIMEAAVIGTALMLVTGCLRLHDIYRNLHWQTLVMLGCLIPLGTAMQSTGMAEFVAQALIVNLSELGPTAVLSGLYLVTMLLTSVMTNNATGVLMVPIALSVAAELGADFKPFIFAIMFGASASFMTPMGYQTNSFIFGAGGYRFSDFVRVGGPLNLLFWILGTLLIPYFWPLYPA